MIRLISILVLIPLLLNSQCENNNIETTARVYVFWGQSNMVGITQAAEWNDIIPLHKIWNGTNFEDQSSENWNTTGYSNSGIELEFSQRLANQHPNDDVYIIKRSHGSTSVAWHWNIISHVSGRGARLLQLKNDIVNAKTVLDNQYDNVIFERIISFIGESDSATTTSANSFAQNYLDTTAEIWNYIGNQVPVTAYKIWASQSFQNSFPLPYVNTVRNEFDVINQHSFINVINTDSVERFDGIHVTRAGFSALENLGF